MFNWSARKSDVTPIAQWPPGGRSRECHRIQTSNGHQSMHALSNSIPPAGDAPTTKRRRGCNRQKWLGNGRLCPLCRIMSSLSWKPDGGFRTRHLQPNPKVGMVAESKPIPIQEACQRPHQSQPAAQPVGVLRGLIRGSVPDEERHLVKPSTHSKEDIATSMLEGIIQQVEEDLF
jgi:hypothetical protein